MNEYNHREKQLPFLYIMFIVEKPYMSYLLELLSLKTSSDCLQGNIKPSDKFYLINIFLVS